MENVAGPFLLLTEFLFAILECDPHCSKCDTNNAGGKCDPGQCQSTYIFDTVTLVCDGNLFYLNHKIIHLK